MGGNITIFTSGSTQEPKRVTHPRDTLLQCVDRSIKETGLSKNDIVLDVFPGNTIAHYTVTAMPAIKAGADYYNLSFEPYQYLKIFNEIRPTYIGLIPRHYEILSKTKEFENLDMSCVRYMTVGSSKIEQAMIDTFLNKGVKLVANWYGMTEMPPPVFVGYNSESFDFTPKEGYTVEFTDEGECVINGLYTGDIFDVENKIFLRRKKNATGSTWKTNV